MPAFNPNPSPLRSGDRLGVTLLAAAALHAVVILSVGFDPTPRPLPELPLTMEITLVHSQEEAPEKADYLAQANQRGGGNVEEKVRPSTPFPATSEEQDGSAPLSQPSAAPPPVVPRSGAPLLDSPRGRLEARIEAVTPPPVREPISAAELMERSREIARLSTEIRLRQESYAQMKRERTISANTRAYHYASYMEAWRMKVERIGNLNYPEEAKRQGISGSLVLDVAIDADGSLIEVTLVRSSGYKVLDDAARRIVELAAPFAPFSEEIRNETDVLHIIRTWQFQSDHRFQTGNR